MVLHEGALEVYWQCWELILLWELCGLVRSLGHDCTSLLHMMHVQMARTALISLGLIEEWKKPKPQQPQMQAGKCQVASQHKPQLQ